MDEILNRIKNSDSFKNIIAEYDPEIVFLGGSRSLGYNRENSDWDIIAYTKRSDFAYKNISLTVDKLHAHCLLYSIEEYFKVLLLSPNAAEHVFQIIGLTMGLSATANTKLILYKKYNAYTEIFDFVVQHKKEITNMFVLQSLSKFNLDLDAIMLSKSINFNKKFYYYFLVGAQILFEEDYTELIRTVIFKQNWTEDKIKTMWSILEKLQVECHNYLPNEYLILSSHIAYLYTNYKEVM